MNKEDDIIGSCSLCVDQFKHKLEMNFSLKLIDESKQGMIVGELKLDVKYSADDQVI